MKKIGTAIAALTFAAGALLAASAPATAAYPRPTGLKIVVITGDGLYGAKIVTRVVYVNGHPRCATVKQDSVVIVNNCPAVLSR